MSVLAEVRDLCAARFAADVAAGRVPELTAETADRVDAALGDASPWRRPAPAKAAA